VRAAGNVLYLGADLVQRFIQIGAYPGQYRAGVCTFQ